MQVTLHTMSVHSVLGISQFTMLVLQVSTAQASHTRHLGEAAQLRQELRQLSSRLELAESDQQHLKVTCKQATATAEAEWATKVIRARVQLQTCTGNGDLLIMTGRNQAVPVGKQVCCNCSLSLLDGCCFAPK